jgi:hypothetical protein
MRSNLMENWKIPVFFCAESKGFIGNFPIFLISVGFTLTLNSNPVFFLFQCFYNPEFQRGSYLPLQRETVEPA